MRKESIPAAIKAVGSLGFIGCVGESSTFAQLKANTAKEIDIKFA
jgi:hypothetical protein